MSARTGAGRVEDTLLCSFCGHNDDGLTFYSAAGMFWLFACTPCYGLLIAKERQPYSQPMKRFHRLLGLNGKEVVVTDERLGRYVEEMGTIVIHSEHYKENLTCVS